jgi:hypothetical protein
MFVNSPRKLAQLALAAVVFYIVVSVVLYVCLEAVEDDMNATGEFGAAFPSRTVLDNVRPWIPWEDGAGRKQFKMVPIAPKGFQREKYNRGGGAERSSGSISVRAEFEKRFPPGDLDRIRKSVEGLRVRSPDSQPSMPYDVYDCPDTPPAGYPMTWKLARQILKDWNPKDTEIPTQIYQGLCVFDWDRDRSKAEAYRAAEVPFVVQNSPEILRASERWNSGGYLQKLVGKAPQRTEHSATAHLMYWKPHPRDRAPPGWTPPSENIEMTIDEFLKRAQEMEDDVHDQLNREHWYFRLNGSYRGKNSYLYDELPIFVPGDEPTFYMIDPGEARGINCRLGMRGENGRCYMCNPLVASYLCASLHSVLKVTWQLLTMIHLSSKFSYATGQSYTNHHLSDVLTSFRIIIPCLPVSLLLQLDRCFGRPAALHPCSPRPMQEPGAVPFWPPVSSALVDRLDQSTQRRRATLRQCHGQ